MERRGSDEAWEIQRSCTPERSHDTMRLGRHAGWQCQPNGCEETGAVSETRSMQWQLNPYVFPMLLSAVLASLLAVLAWRRRPVPGATTMTVLMLVLAAWAILYAIELAAVDLASKLFWARLQYAAFLSVPVLWLVFVLQYTNQEKMLSRRSIVLLAIVPLVTLALVWTTERHGLIYRRPVWTPAKAFHCWRWSTAWPSGSRASTIISCLWSRQPSPFERSCSHHPFSGLKWARCSSPPWCL